MNWDLTTIFKNDLELGNFIQKLDSTVSNFNEKYNNNLANLSKEEFYSAIKEYDETLEKIEKIMSYAYLCFAKNTTNGSLLAKYEDICNKLEEKLLFFMIEFNQIPKQKQDEFIEFCEKYSYFLSLNVKQKSHQLTFLEEKVLLRTQNTGASAFSRLFDESMTRMKFKFRDEILDQEMIFAKMSSKDREVRKDAAITISETLEQNLHLLGYIYNIIKTDLKNISELRKYDLPESSRHESNQIEKASVDALILASQNSFDLVSKYYDKKREILGYETIYDYDRYAPLDDGDEINFKEAKQIILEAFGSFSPQFAQLAQKAFDENWCDVFVCQNKQSGAFAHSCVSDVHPFVLLNYTNRRRDVFTLAHELGHAIHQYLSYQVGFLNSQTPLTTAETASVFCEMLVFDHIKNNIPKHKISALLAGKLEDIFATLYRQINFTTFERRIHAYDGEIPIEKINEIWLEESKKMFGDSLKLNDYYKIWWSYIPHFIHSPFYCYAYAYAQLLVLALFGLYKSKKCVDFVEIYTNFLRLGGSKSPREMVGMFGFDINSVDFWQIGLKQIESLVNEFIENTGNKNA